MHHAYDYVTAGFGMNARRKPVDLDRGNKDDVVEDRHVEEPRDDVSKAHGRRREHVAERPDRDACATADGKAAYSNARFEARTTACGEEYVIKLARRDDGSLLTQKEVLTLWQSDVEFVDFWNGVLASAPFEFFYWECGCFESRDAAGEATFACVLIDAQPFARANPSAFADQLRTTTVDTLVTEFENLGRDATLVVPCPPAKNHGPAPYGSRGGGRKKQIATADAGACYGHLAAFVRNAPIQQRRVLWARVAKAVKETLGTRATYLSTDGRGVPWLHVRLDKRPKYYKSSLRATGPTVAPAPRHVFAAPEGHARSGGARGHNGGANGEDDVHRGRGNGDGYDDDGNRGGGGDRAKVAPPVMHDMHHESTVAARSVEPAAQPPYAPPAGAVRRDETSYAYRGYGASGGGYAASVGSYAASVAGGASMDG